MRKAFSMMIVLLLVLVGQYSQAQPRVPDPDDPPEEPEPSQMRNLENLRLLKLLDLLNLSEEQSTEFISEFGNFRKQMRQLRQDCEREVDTLAELAKEKSPEIKQVQQHIAEIDRLRIRRAELTGEFHVKVTKILTPVQLGKMVVFEERFERELIENIRGFRGRRRGPQAPMNKRL
ncbi:MAG: hypothetical protein JSV44_00160 [Candidatus Zixiibacteriota bacterium]|nr:MAG: hypothetical protein JSV44_00160 [candidate division Zixibacteria bacterium]